MMPTSPFPRRPVVRLVYSALHGIGPAACLSDITDWWPVLPHGHVALKDARHARCGTNGIEVGYSVGPPGLDQEPTTDEGG